MPLCCIHSINPPIGTPEGAMAAFAGLRPFSSMFKHRDAEFALEFEDARARLAVRHDGATGAYVATCGSLFADSAFSWDELCDFSEAVLAGGSGACRVVSALAEGAQRLVFFDVREVAHPSLWLATGVPGGATVADGADYLRAAADGAYAAAEAPKQRAVAVVQEDERTLALVVRAAVGGPTFRVRFQGRDGTCAFVGASAAAGHRDFRGPPFVVALSSRVEKDVSLYDSICHVFGKNDALYEALRSVRTAAEAREAARAVAELVFFDAPRIGRARSVDGSVYHVF
jgi:hypothetical protein